MFVCPKTQVNLLTQSDCVPVCRQTESRFTSHQLVQAFTSVCVRVCYVGIDKRTQTNRLDKDYFSLSPLKIYSRPKPHLKYFSTIHPQLIPKNDEKSRLYE